MSFTTLRVTAAGVVLFDQHARRLGSAAALAAFARTATPGVYRVILEGERLHATPREESRLRDDLALRLLPSPLPRSAGRIPKPGAPGIYDAVRLPGLATLLTSEDGRELWESCSAAVIAWDGIRLVSPPLDRPRVRSTAEDALDEAGLLTHAPVSTETQSLLLINALGAVIPAGSGFPVAQRALLLERLARSAHRGDA
jgi:hypothetical protein